MDHVVNLTLDLVVPDLTRDLRTFLVTEHFYAS